MLQILKDNDAKATFFEIGNKVAANPEGAKRVVEAGMELGSHTWEHPNMTTIPPEDIPAQFSKASDAIEAATGQRPKLVRTAGGLINDQVLAEAKKQGLADINWDVIPFDWANDANTARDPLHADDPDQAELRGAVPRHVLVDRRPGAAVHPRAQGQRLPHGDRHARCSASGRRAPPTAAATTARPSTNSSTSRPAEIPSLPNTPSPAPMPNIPITDIPGQNSGGPNNGA